jgi:SAM-dependent methyltransferase
MTSPGPALAGYGDEFRQEGPMSTQTGQERSWTPASIRELAMGFQASRVLLTAVELRVFSVLADEGLTSAEIAGRVGGDPRATDRLLNAVCALGLLNKRGGRFRNTPDSRRYLDGTSPEYSAGLGHTVSMWRAWSGLTDAVREGRPSLRASINDRGDAWLEPFIAAMHYRAAQQAPRVAGLLGLDGVARALDVGGGSGAFAMAFARQQPGLSAVVFDLPNVVPLTQKYIADEGLASRVTTAVGDYLVDPMPGGFDLVFLSAVVHSNSPDENAALIRSCAASLNPGGRVAVVDFVMDEDRLAPESGAFFALNMLVATDHGDTFTEAEIRGWLTSAGLERGPRIDAGFGSAIVIGVKSARH